MEPRQTTTVTEKIELCWSSEQENLIRISLSDPVDQPDGEVISAMMENVLSQNVLQDSKGSNAVSVSSARVLKTTVEQTQLF